MWDYKSCLLNFLDTRGLYYISNLGKGSYGRVFHVKTLAKQSFAAKFVPEESVNLHELESWKEFDHPNILKLLDTDTSEKKTVVFMMNIMPMSLSTFITNPANLQETFSFSRSMRFLRDVLCGLDYLHELKYCHLDLTSSNIFISEDEIAKIGDFSGLAKAAEKKKNCLLPNKFWPPELSGKSRKVWPLPIDLWAYGLLAIQTMIGHHFFTCLLEDSNDNWEMWIKDLNEKASIHNFIKMTYPSSPISTNITEEFLDFALQFMVLHPKKRLSAHNGLSHMFFQNVSPTH